MNKRVIKIGGSLLTNSERLRSLLQIFDHHEGEQVLVVSAFKNVTNLLEKWFDDKSVEALEELVKIHRNFFNTLFPDKIFEKDFEDFDEIKQIHMRLLSRDAALALGEKMSSRIIERFLQESGIDISSHDSDPLAFGNPDSFNFEFSQKVIRDFFASKKTKHIITQGFASWDGGNLSNLGREGSDLTAALWAQSLNAECILYKDVGALYTKDPHKYPEAEKISQISFTDYKENFFGAGVVYDKLIDFCLERGQDLAIYSFSENSLGTRFLKS